MRQAKYRAYVPKYERMFQVGTLYTTNRKGLSAQGISISTDDELDERDGLELSALKRTGNIKPGVFYLMQSTDLVDKNGKEIYEGDIISVVTHHYNQRTQEETHSYIYKDVKFKKGSFVVELTNPHSPVDKLLNSYNNYSEIIGNIYENKELLHERI